MIWGVLIILIGLSILIKAVFHIDVPIARIAVGVVLVYLGFKLILGGWGGWRWFELPQEASVFSSRSVRLAPGESPARAYTAVFGSTQLDLTGVRLSEADVYVEVSVIFGSATVEVAPGQPVEVEANVAFGDARLPNDAKVALGRNTWRSEGAAAAPHRLHVRANVVFGSFHLRRP